MNDHEEHITQSEQTDPNINHDDAVHEAVDNNHASCQDGQTEQDVIAQDEKSNDVHAASDQRSLEHTEDDTAHHADDAAGEEMLAILEDVETQFQKLRTVQQSNDAMISSLSERAQALTNAESELATEREGLLAKLNDFEQDKATLEQQHQDQTEQYQIDRQALAADQQGFEEHKSTTERQLEEAQLTLDAAQSELEQQVTDINKQQEEIASHTKELENKSKSLKARDAELATKAEQLGDTESKLSEADQTIASLNETLETTNTDYENKLQSLASQNSSLEEKIRNGKNKRAQLREQLSLSEKNLGEIQQQLTERTTHVDQLNSEITSLKTSLDETKDTAAASEHDALELISGLESERDSISQTLNTLQQDHAAKNEEASALALQCEDMTGQIDRLRSHLAERETRLEDNQSKLRVAGEKLTHFAESLRDQGPLLERGAAAMAMVEEQKQQIQALTTEVAQLKVQGAPDELAKKDDRIKSLTEALRQARGQTAGQQDLSQLEQSNAELCEELEGTKIALHEAQIAMEQAKKQIAERSADSDSEHINDARVSELEATHAALKAQLDEATLREQTVSERYEDRISELQDDLDHAQSAINCGDGTESGMIKELRDKAKRINGVAVHLRRRRKRLGQVRQLLESKTRASSTTGAVDLEQHSRQLRSIEDERQQLTELRTVLEASERKMIRKWAHSKAVFACLWLLVIGTAMAGVSWAITEHFHPAVRSATVTLEAKGTTHSTLDADQNATWAGWHKDLLKNETFTRTLSRRMGDRRFEKYRNPQAVADRIARDLTIDSSVPGALALTLVGTDPAETEAFLNLLTATVISESARSTGKHPDGAKAIAPHQTSDGTGIRYATLSSTPVSDERLTKALPIFGGALAGALLLIAMTYAWLSRAKRVFDEADPVSEYDEIAMQTT